MGKIYRSEADFENVNKKLAKKNQNKKSKLKFKKKFEQE
jgi:hypothetical protein